MLDSNVSTATVNHTSQNNGSKKAGKAGASSFYTNVLPWIVWCIAALFYGYQFVVRVSPNVMVTELMSAFSITASAVGALGGMYYLAYAPMQIPVGMLLDKLGPKRLITIAAIICASGCFLFATAKTLWIAQIARFLMGMGSACGFIGAFKVATVWFSPRHLSMIVGLIMMLGTLGGASGAPFAVLVKNVGWEQSFLILTAVGGVIATLVFLVVRDKPKVKLFDAVAEEKQLGVLESLRRIVVNPQCWLVGFFGFLMYVPLSVFGDQWGASYLMQRYCINTVDAAAPASMMYIGVMFGAPFFGWFSNYLKSRRIPMMIAACGVAFFFALVLYLPGDSLSLMYVLLFASGFMMGGQFLVFTVAYELNATNTGGTASGFTNTICMLTGIFFQPLVGRVLDICWEGQMENGIRIYTTTGYQWGLSLIPVGACLALVVLLFLRETFGAHEKH